MGFDSSADPIIGSKIRVDFEIDKSIAKELLDFYGFDVKPESDWDTAVGRENAKKRGLTQERIQELREDDYNRVSYTIVERNHKQYLCQVLDHEILKAAYCLEDIMEDTKIVENQQLINFSEYLRNTRKGRRKLRICRYILIIICIGLLAVSFSTIKYLG